MAKIVFTADLHIRENLTGLSNQAIYERLLKLADEINKLNPDLVILGGDVFDRSPTLLELFWYKEFVKQINSIIYVYDGNHEATKKGGHFLGFVKDIVQADNVTYIMGTYNDTNYGFSILPYHKLKTGVAECEFPILFTHVRGRIGNIVKEEVDLSMFSRFDMVFAGDLHDHTNSQLNIIYSGSPYPTTIVKETPKKGILLIDTDDYSYQFVELQLEYKRINEDDLIEENNDQEDVNAELLDYNEFIGGVTNNIDGVICRLLEESGKSHLIDLYNKYSIKVNGDKYDH